MDSPWTLKNDIAKQTCEAVGCREEATEQLAVNAGKFGTLVLFVCKGCTSKFTEE